MNLSTEQEMILRLAKEISEIKDDQYETEKSLKELATVVKSCYEKILEIERRLNSMEN